MHPYTRLSKSGKTLYILLKCVICNALLIITVDSILKTTGKRFIRYCMEHFHHMALNVWIQKSLFFVRLISGAGTERSQLKQYSSAITPQGPGSFPQEWLNNAGKFKTTWQMFFMVTKKDFSQNFCGLYSYWQKCNCKWKTFRRNTNFFSWCW